MPIAVKMTKALATFLLIASQATVAFGQETQAEPIGYIWHFSDGATRKLVTEGQGIALIWIDGLQHSIATFSSGGTLAAQVDTTATSRDTLLPGVAKSEHSASEKPHDEIVKLEFLPTIVGLQRLDTSSIKLDVAPGPTVLVAPEGALPRTCGTCGFTYLCVSNACTPCNDGWLCDKIQAPE
jgi:hypothetical protein